MAKLTPGMKQDWKHRPSKGGQPMNRMVRLFFVATLFLILVGVLVWFLLPPAQQRTYFFAADRVEYDLGATMPLVHSSVAQELALDGNHDPKSFHMGGIALEKSLPPINQLAAQVASGNLPGQHDACVLYIQAHTLRYDVEGTPHVVVATQTFLRKTLANWESRGVLPLSDVLDWMETANCPLKLVLLDAGTIVTDGRIDLYENNFTSALESEMRGRKDPNLFLITSHENGQKSLSLSLQRNSIFSQAVQEALTGKGISDISGDNALDLNELYHHICVRVQNHLGEGVIAQTPRLFQGGQGILTKNFPAKFVCRYYQEEPKKEGEEEASEDSKEKESPPPSETQPDAEKDDAKQDGEADKEKDPRWATLDEVWHLREQLAQPPSRRGDMIWSPIDFAPQYFRRLDDYLIGYQFRLLFESGDVEAAHLAEMKNQLEVLLAHLPEQRKVQITSPLGDSPADNLIQAWNKFVDTPYQLAWSADLTDDGIKARDAILGWNYCVYHVPELTQMFEHTGSDSTLARYELLLKDIHDVTIGMLEVPAHGPDGPELTHLPMASIINGSLTDLDGMRRFGNADMTIVPRNQESSNLNAQMADALRLIGYLQTAMPTAADRKKMADSLRQFSQQPVPDYTYIDNSTPFLARLSTAMLPRASEASMEKLRTLYLKIAGAGSPPSDDSAAPFIELGETIQANMPADAEYRSQVLYQVRVRSLDWRDTPQIVGEVSPLPFRFPVKEKIPRLTVRPGKETQSLQLDRIAEKVDFEIELVAANFPPGKVVFNLEYDRTVLDVSFKNEDLAASGDTLDYNIDASGPITIRGSVSARIDREKNASRRNMADIRAAQSEPIVFTIPAKYIPPGAESSRSCKLNVSLPWAEEVDVVVQQTGASGAGIYYGQRVQIPLFDNRESEFNLGLINRSRINRKVKVSIYPVVRPETSLMPTGRIFSDQYHRKPLDGGANSQEAEITPWRVATYERPTITLGNDFLPTGVASDVSLASYDQIPPPSTRERGRIVNDTVQPDRCQWLKFTGPPGPPGPDGKPGIGGKVTPTDISNGLLVVIEDLENKDVNNNPVRWMRWIEWVPRAPQSYLDVQTSVLPVDKLSRLEMIVQPITGEHSLPTATWDEERLFGFPSLPHNLAKVPIRVEWDWKWQDTFEDSELIKRQAFGTISSPEATATLGAILNLDGTKPVRRPILLDIACAEKLPTLRRAFRNVMDLDSGKLDADASAGFEALRLDAYLPHIEDEEKPSPAVDVMASSWADSRLPIILPPNIETIDWMLAISTDTNSFNGASEIKPDKIQLGLLEKGNGFESARLNFTETIYSNRSFSAELTAAQAEGPLVITATLQDVVAKGLSAKTYETFVGDFVVEIYNGTKQVNDLRIPVVIDKDPPTINIQPSPLTIPVNEGLKVTIPTQDNDSGIKYLEYGSPGPGDTIADKPLKLEPLVGNILPNPNDTFLRIPQFLLTIRPEDLKWDAGTTQKLRVRAVNRADLKSAPLDLIVRVGPKSNAPMNAGGPMQPMIIKAQVVFVNGRPATDPQYQPSIKEVPVQPRLDADGVTWVFESDMLKPGTKYTLVSSGRQSSGGIKSTETEAEATPAKENAPVYKLKFD
ncbi:hypothetical protein C5Y96_03525 [Blastopirellula marina]|uniref:Uncharacterized protein n=1 Tax=Blastopirellula marina TaxID=124 RepID=A0A2S8G3C2_9BACT|nr:MULTISPECIES: hypothetical protein [Pirellulaceae]PQO38955.1 hypothetical protein C5Y96_03525 [Blastopirellula marina]RCS55263.1 hypothetical protein DTL36_03530 [Bremerella cremea]